MRSEHHKRYHLACTFRNEEIAPSDQRTKIRAHRGRHFSDPPDVGPVSCLDNLIDAIKIARRCRTNRKRVFSHRPRVGVCRYRVKWTRVTQESWSYAMVPELGDSERLVGHVKLTPNAKLASQTEAETRVVGRVSHDEHRINTTSPALLQPRIHQLRTDSPSLMRWQDGQWSKSRQRTAAAFDLHA